MLWMIHIGKGKFFIVKFWLVPDALCINIICYEFKFSYENFSRVQRRMEGRKKIYIIKHSSVCKSLWTFNLD